MNPRDEDDRLVQLVEDRLRGNPLHTQPIIHDRLRKSGIDAVIRVLGLSVGLDKLLDASVMESLRKEFENEASSILEANWLVKIVPPTLHGTKEILLELHPDNPEITDVLQIRLSFSLSL